jgi:hypothetical protein
MGDVAFYSRPGAAITLLLRKEQAVAKLKVFERNRQNY